MNNNALEALKWVGIVLAAGFVGYFGRYLAMLIIARLRKDKATPPAAADVKLAKKQAKQVVKQTKKAAKKS